MEATNPQTTDPITPPPGPDATGELAAELVDAMPAATVDADAAELFDAPRVEKDPKTGKPNRRVDGGVRQARGQKPKPKPKPKPKAADATEPGPTTDGARAGEVIDPRQLQARVAAETLAETLRTVGTMLGGNEWDWQGGAQGERAAFVAAWEGYFIQAGTPNLPAWIAPAVVTGQYVGSRLHLPRTREATRSLWQRIKDAAVRVYVRWKGL